MCCINSSYECIPDELWSNIFVFAGPISTVRLNEVSRKFYNLSQDRTVWQYFCEHELTDQSWRSMVEHPKQIFALYYPIQIQAKASLSQLHTNIKNKTFQLRESRFPGNYHRFFQSEGLLCFYSHGSGCEIYDENGKHHLTIEIEKGAEAANVIDTFTLPSEDSHGFTVSFLIVQEPLYEPISHFSASNSHYVTVVGSRKVNLWNRSTNKLEADYEHAKRFSSISLIGETLFMQDTENTLMSHNFATHTTSLLDRKIKLIKKIADARFSALSHNGELTIWENESSIVSHKLNATVKDFAFNDPVDHIALLTLRENTYELTIHAVDSSYSIESESIVTYPFEGYYQSLIWKHSYPWLHVNQQFIRIDVSQEQSGQYYFLRPNTNCTWLNHMMLLHDHTWKLYDFGGTSVSLKEAKRKTIVEAASSNSSSQADSERSSSSEEESVNESSHEPSQKRRKKEK